MVLTEKMTLNCEIRKRRLDFLTNLNNLASLAILDDKNAGIIRADERKKRVREQLIDGIPYNYTKVLLQENEKNYGGLPLLYYSQKKSN